jgi:hypothetical protein
VLIESKSERAREIARIMEQHSVSYSTASRWIDSGKLPELEARHVDRARLREECEETGVSLARAHSRKWEGFPREALAMPFKRVSK